MNPNDGFKNVHLQAKVADKGMLGVDVEKKYGDSVNRFYVTLSGKNRPDDKVLITLSREGFFFWKLQTCFCRSGRNLHLLKNS